MSPTSGTAYTGTISVNGVSYGEGGINALYASLVHNVPVILASGDQAFCAEITDLIPGIATVRTKTSLTASAALSRPPEIPRTCRSIASQLS